MKYLSISAFIVLSVFVIGCGGGTGSETPQPAGTVINSFVLPPEPDPALVNATIEGVDVNNNGVRDEVERKIIVDMEQSALPYSGTAVALQYAAAFQSSLNNPVRKNDSVLRAIDCENELIDKKYAAAKEKDPTVDIVDIINAVDEVMEKIKAKDLVLNTSDRLDAYYLWNSSKAGKVVSQPKDLSGVCSYNIDELMAMEK